MKNPEIYEKLKKIKKELEEKGELLDGFGEELDALEKAEGPDLGPRNDIEYQKLLREIRSLDDK